MTRKLPKKPIKLLEVGDIIRLPLIQSDGRKSRPVVIEDIRHGQITFRPITDSYRDANLINNDIRMSKDEVYHITDWRDAGLEKPSAVAVGVQKTVSTFDLPNSILYYGKLSKNDLAKIPDYDRKLKQFMDSIKMYPDTYYNFVSTRNRANEISFSGIPIIYPNSGAVDLSAFAPKINFDIKIDETPKIVPKSRNFKAEREAAAKLAAQQKDDARLKAQNENQPDFEPDF